MDESKKKQVLREAAFRQLASIRKALRGNTAALCNCDLVAKVLQNDHEEPCHQVMMIGAEIQPYGEGRAEFVLYIFGFNAERDTTEVILTGLDGKGQWYRLAYPFDPKIKSPSLMVSFVRRVQLVPVGHMSELTVRKEDGAWQLRQKVPLQLPEGVSLAVAIKTRKGLISPFVPIVDRRGPRLSDER